ncbi:MAG: MBL fold metallo-hydrolase [Lachnospiraceae bacterium]|nr:MBL fold metallo-hydrolase [Lachnospiraceae bacterium]
MKKGLKVTYLKHSGFLVEMEDKYLLFDYWKGEIPALDYKKTLYVFVSHVHHDHYAKDIFKLENRCEVVKYILSFDIQRTNSWKQAEQVYFLDARESVEIDDLQIKTLCSTDEGVAFLIKTSGYTIYHAGDLHWWHWPGDPEEDNQRRKDTYQKEIDLLTGENIDCAFVVLDPRQEEAGSWGMDYFLKQVGARYIFPMHCWEKYSIIKEYIDKNERKYLTGTIMNITAPGQTFNIDRD